MFINSDVAVTPFYFFPSVSSTSIFISPVSRISYSFIPAISVNFPDHICHFSFFLKGDNPDALFFHLVFSFHVFPQITGLRVLLRSIFEGSDNLDAYSTLYKLRVLYFVFNSVYFRILIKFNFHHKHNNLKIIIRTLSSSF